MNLLFRFGLFVLPAIPAILCLIIGFREYDEGPPSGPTVSLSRSPDEIIIDSDVPGTELYLDERKLGTVPYTITPDSLLDFGVEAVMSLEDVWTHDDEPAGVNLWFTGGVKKMMTITFRVPEEADARYHTLETPWGARTCLEDFRSTSNPESASILLRPQPVSWRDLDLSIEVAPLRSGQPFRITVTATSRDLDMLFASPPHLAILRHPYHYFDPCICPAYPELPPEWSHFSAGEKRTFTVTTDLPSGPVYYVLQAVLRLPATKRSSECVVRSNAVLVEVE